MIPFRFGPDQAQLYGCLHRPASHISGGKAVLLCNPFGQESIRLHRLYRVLADRLARNGHAVLRFDYLGTGDSDGDDETPGLDQWKRDLLLAHRELRSRVGQRPTLWIGARLGAWLASRASAELDEPLDGLGLWAPIQDGPTYLKELARAHVDAQYDLLRPAVPAIDTLGREAIGFSVSDGFKDAVHDIRAEDYAQHRANRIWIVTDRPASPDPNERQALSMALPSAREVPLKLSFDWTSEEALNTALVPNDAVRLLASLVNGDRHG